MLFAITGTLLLGVRSQAESIKIRLRKKYYITNKYSVKYFLENASYSLENEFSRWIDSFGEDSDIIVALRSIPAQTGARKLKAMRAERASEIRVNKSVDARNEKIRSEIPELDRMLKSTGLNGNSLFDLSLTVKISSSHPASLQRSVNKFLMSMDLLGLKFRAPEYMRKNALFMDLFQSARTRYLVDSDPLSTMVPLFVSAEPDTSGILIGSDASTGMPIFLNQMKEASHNLLIIGETGSGKSYFGKILLMRLLITGVCKRAVIVDPLDEYGAEFFGGANILDASRGEYIDFFEYYDAERRVSEAITFFTDTLSLNEDERSALRAASSSLHDYDGIPSVIEKLSENIRDPDLNDKLRYLKDRFFRKKIEVQLKNARVTIIRAPSEPGQEREKLLAFSLTTARYIARSDGTDKALLIDEMHLFQNNPGTALFLANLFRNSRHFNTSVIGITQNSYDLEGSQFANTIRDNSIASFIFRTGSTKGTGNELGRIDYAGIKPELLAGGKNYNHSECFMIFKGRIKKLHISATEYERRIIQNLLPEAYSFPDRGRAEEHQSL